MVTLFGKDDRLIFACSMVGCEFIFFVCFSCLLWLFEDFLVRWRIDEKKEPRKNLLSSAFKEAFIAIVLHIALYYVLWPAWKPGLVVDGEGDSWRTLALFSYFSFATNEVFFYFAHRMFHEIPALYKLHKQHHEFNFTKGIAAEYANIIEAIVANFLPTVSGWIIWSRVWGPVRLSTFVFYLMFRLIETTENHSGFLFPVSINYLIPTHWIDYGRRHGVSSFHYFHHSHNTGNFGTPFMDWLFGTDKTYREYVDKKIKQRAKVHSA